MKRLTVKQLPYAPFDWVGGVYLTGGTPTDLCPKTFCKNGTKCARNEDRTCPFLAALDRLAEYEDTGLMPSEIVKLQSPRDWTPCTEGLPTTNDDVYITYEYRGKRFASVGFMGNSGNWYILSDDDGNEQRVNAIAWQPLPAPYRADDTTGKAKKDEFMREAMYDQLHSNGN